jgi:hypothetical protein
MDNFAQQPITSGVFHWNDLPVKKDKNGKAEKFSKALLLNLNILKYMQQHNTKAPCQGHRILMTA